MSMAQDIGEFKKALDYRTLRKSLMLGRILAGLAAFAGIVVGISNIHESAFNIIPLILGCFLALEVIWSFIAISPIIIIIDGSALCLCATWNFVLFFMNFDKDISPVFYGVLMVIFGVMSFRRLFHFSHVISYKPSKETLKQVEDMVKSIIKPSPGEAERIIELKLKAVDGLFNSIFRISWEGGLLGDIAVFVARYNNDAIFARLDEVNIVPVGEASKEKVQKVSAQIGERNFTGEISLKSMERYESWKKGVTSSTS